MVLYGTTRQCFVPTMIRVSFRALAPPFLVKEMAVSIHKEPHARKTKLLTG